MEILRMKHKARDLNTERSEEPHEGLSIRLDTAEERFPELEYTSPNWKESQKEKPKQSPECPRMLDNCKRCNMCIMGTPKGEEKEGKEVFETVTDCFPNLMSDTKPQMQEVQRTPSGVNTLLGGSPVPTRSTGERLHLWFYFAIVIMLSIHLAWNTFPQESWALIFWKNVKLQGENQAPSFAMFSWYSVCCLALGISRRHKEISDKPLHFPISSLCLCSNSVYVPT